jgi:hypothetical protein
MNASRSPKICQPKHTPWTIDRLRFQRVMSGFLDSSTKLLMSPLLHRFLSFFGLPLVSNSYLLSSSAPSLFTSIPPLPSLYHVTGLLLISGVPMIAGAVTTLTSLCTSPTAYIATSTLFVSILRHQLSDPLTRLARTSIPQGVVLGHAATSSGSLVASC